MYLPTIPCKSNFKKLFVIHAHLFKIFYRQQFIWEGLSLIYSKGLMQMCIEDYFHRKVQTCLQMLRSEQNFFPMVDCKTIKIVINNSVKMNKVTVVNWYFGNKQIGILYLSIMFLACALMHSLTLTAADQWYKMPIIHSKGILVQHCFSQSSFI